MTIFFITSYGNFEIFTSIWICHMCIKAYRLYHIVQVFNSSLIFVFVFNVDIGDSNPFYLYWKWKLNILSKCPACATTEKAFMWLLIKKQQQQKLQTYKKEAEACASTVFVSLICKIFSVWSLKSKSMHITQLFL